MLTDTVDITLAAMAQAMTATVTARTTTRMDMVHRTTATVVATAASSDMAEKPA